MKLIEWIKSLFPQPCLLCQRPCEEPIALCTICQNHLPWNTMACQQCAIPLDSPSPLCGSCLSHPPPFHSMIAPLQYEFPINHLISQLKFQKKLIVGRTLGQLLAQKIQLLRGKTPLPEAIIPIPLHRERLKSRGFNQSLEIAKVVSKALKIPLLKHHCSRIKKTKPQATLNAKARIDNIKKAFSVEHKINLKHIAIIDDVVTTGHTVSELSLVLQKQGVNKIEVWSPARATFSRHKP